MQISISRLGIFLAVIVSLHSLAAQQIAPLEASQQSINKAGEIEARILNFKEFQSSPNELSTDFLRQRNGKFVYGLDSDGNRLCDFSHAGYEGGGVRLPDVPVVGQLEVSTGGGDDTRRIQEALDRVAQREPDASGFRGALLLGKGKFIVSNTLFIRASGVVLRGQGAGFGGTWIYHRTPEITDPVPPEYVHGTAYKECLLERDRLDERKLDHF